MKTPLGILILLLGAWLLFAGFSRRDSLAGQASEAGTNLANAIDGGARTPKHYVYIVAGAVCAIAGATMAFRRGHHVH